MGALQLQFQSRFSKILSSTIRKWEIKSPFHDPLLTPDFLLLPQQSRRFSSNSMADDSDLSNSEPRSSPADQHDDRNQQGTSFRFENERSLQLSESLSHKDFSFLENFKLNTDNHNHSSSSKKKKMEQSYPHRISQQQPLAPPEADELFDKMKETGLIPYAAAMFNGLCEDQLIQEAMKLLGLIREKGTMPSVVIYTAVVDGFCQAEKPDEAIRIFRKMQNNGISPNAFSFGVMIQGLYKCRKLEEAVALCVEMLECGHSPNLTTFVGLIDELCKEKGVEEAQSVVETFKQKGYLIDEKALRYYFYKRAPFSLSVWKEIFGKKTKEFF